MLDNSAQRGRGYDELLERASWFYEAVSFSEAMKSQTPGLGQAYLGQLHRRQRRLARRRRDYTLHVPADPPAKLFWSATVYDVATRCLIDNEQQRGDRGSRDAELVTNADGSVDLSFGPHPPAAARTTGCRPSPASTGSPTSGSTGRWSRTSTGAGNSATSLPPDVTPDRATLAIACSLHPALTCDRPASAPRA